MALMRALAISTWRCASVEIALNETQRQLRDTVRAFATARLKPAAAETDRLGRFPRELVAELGRLGIMGCFVPESYGGAGSDYVGYARPVEELSVAGAAPGGLFSGHPPPPPSPILGPEYEGFKVAMKTLDGGRIGIAAQAVGIARAALEDSLAYVQDRRAFGQAIVEFQGTQWRLADMATAVEAARLLTLRAAFLK